MAMPKSANQNEIGSEVKGWVASFERPQLKSGGDGGNNGGMEKRMDALEKRFDKIETKFDSLQKDFGDVRIQIATLVERVAHLPGKGFIVTATISALALFSALMIFKEKIALLLG
ncbi:hypothetical protein [Rhizobium sp. Root483D2]|uniref:hypothetical protein n=2 Tax=Rhizobium/Agrobacterium group TaxID=227290 RepID=UPI0007132B0E|nr:hypothetical protein [Rhizobium sp. Root483D2]KQY34164.1 hypothetical protein ASD32_23315 [Rhizobium sp. Root483D2]